MLTRKLKIKNDINVSDYCERYTGMYHELFFHFEESEDKNFQAYIRDKYSMDSWLYQSCKTEVEVKLKQIATSYKKKKAELDELLSITEFKSKRHRYYVLKSIAYLSENIGKNIIFGGKAMIRRISFLSNPIKSRKQKHKRMNARELKRVRSNFKNRRMMPISIIGEAPQNSNRKFNFDFVNKKVIFKPEKGLKIEIEFNCAKNVHGILCRLQEYVGTQAISVKINNDYIWITYDEEKLAGFEFNSKEYYKELKTIDKTDKEAKTKCAQKHFKIQEDKKLVGKIANRTMGIDLNPEYIGLSIMDKISEDGKNNKIILKKCISFKKLNTKLKLSSDDKKQIKQNNKRIHELNCAWKHIFELAQHYKVANFTMEQLEFKKDLINDNAKEANRKTKNIWHRTKTTNLITKHCNTIGLKLIEVNACYSSFIGNIKHGLFDPVSASLEITRRGITKYIAGSGFYPELEGSDLDTMSQLGLDVQNKTISSWVEAYRLFKTSELRYRLELQKCKSTESNLLSHKSRTISYNFL